MTKTDILLYGALLESDMYADGYGSTDEDTELLQKALKKIYGVAEGASRDVLDLGVRWQSIWVIINTFKGLF